jgi:uncharacterized phage protein (TIGR02218 family)
MTRRVPVEFQARLDSGATRMCRCWLLTRRDGVQYGFTDHDVDLRIDGVDFVAGAGMDSSEIQSSTGLSVDNAQASGGLRADGLNEAEIAAGKFDGAGVTLWLVDWSAPELRVLLFRGHVGEIRRGTLAFEAELRGLAEALNKPVGRAYLRRCDARLGDARCRVDLQANGVSADGTVIQPVQGDVVRLAVESDKPAGWFDGGWLETGGQRLAVQGDAVGGGGRELCLDRSVFLAAGEPVRLVAGCDGSMKSCREKFGNHLNFRGFPHMPDEDFVMSYPRDGEKPDGGSLFRK